MARQRQSEKRLVTTELKVDKNTFKLLNDEKLGRVLDLIDGVRQPERDENGNLSSEGLAFEEAKKAFKDNKEKIVLSLYDRLAGGIRLGDRIIQTGTFWNTAVRKPIDKPDLTEEDFGDERILVPKKKNKAKKRETTVERLSRLKGKKKEDKE